MVSTLLPTVGCVNTTSPSDSLYSAVVFPALSNPRICLSSEQRIRAGRLRERLSRMATNRASQVSKRTSSL
jgi:hypothetical protein